LIGLMTDHFMQKGKNTEINEIFSTTKPNVSGSN
jgi:hypothetical protein